MRRVILFRNGTQVDGKVILVTHSLEELLKTASQKFGFDAKKVFTSQGGEIDDIKLIRDDDVLYVTGEEPFIKVDISKKNYAPSVLLKDPVDNECSCSSNHKHLADDSKCNSGAAINTLSSTLDTEVLTPGFESLRCSFLLHQRLRPAHNSGEVFSLHKPVSGLTTRYRIIQENGLGALLELRWDLPATLTDKADESQCETYENDSKNPTNASSLQRTSSEDAERRKEGWKLQDWVKLNVGGKLFTTSRSTLVTKEPTSMLARMFAQDEDGYLMSPSDLDENGAYLIDRSPTYFEPILNYLRNGQLIFDNNVNPAGILQEARFFRIESLVEHLENLISTQQRSQDIAPLTRRDVINALITTPYTAELRFQGVNLAGSDLSRLDLRNINFKYACLHGCRMVGANLSWCYLERADLSHAIMESAQLMGVKMLCANLEGANLRGCNFQDPNGGRTNMEGVNLKGANLECSNMAGVNLRVANLKNANLQNCDLRGAVLAGADLEKCDLSGSDLHEANLRGANLKDAAFELMLTPIHMSQTIR